MIGFRVQLNRDEAVTAGLGGDHVVSVIVTSTEKDPSRRPPGTPPNEQRVHVGGLRVGADGSLNHMLWFDNSLKVGDKITIEVVDASAVDVPRPTETTSAEVVERGERKQLEYLIGKYGTP